MKTAIVETYRIKNEELLPEHDSLLVKLLDYVVDHAEKQEWKPPAIMTFTVQDSVLERVWIALFESREHQEEWRAIFDGFREGDEKFQNIWDMFWGLTADFNAENVIEYYSR